MKDDMQWEKETQNCDDYGKYYWCVKSGLSENGEIYVHANRVEVLNGCIVFYGNDDVINLSISDGYWSAVFAASVIDGSAVAVEHWKGEIID